MEDQAKPPVDVKDFIGTLKSLSDQAALLQGMPEVKNGARLESAVNDISKRVDMLREQMEEVLGTMQAIERRLAELTEPVTRAGPDEAPLAGTEEDARPEQKGTTVKEVLLSGSWGLTWDRVEELNDSSLNLFLEMLGRKTEGTARKKRLRLRRVLDLSNVPTVDPWAASVDVEETAKDAAGAQVSGESCGS